ncbi:hypothetical protein D3C75_814520 [compost metagenome]
MQPQLHRLSDPVIFLQKNYQLPREKQIDNGIRCPVADGTVLLQGMAEAVFKHPDSHGGVIQSLKLHMKFSFSAWKFHCQEKISLNTAQSVTDKPAVGIVQFHAVLREGFLKQPVNQLDHSSFG